MSAYRAIERTFFNTLTKKIVGNVLFLLLPNVIILSIAVWVYRELQEHSLAVADQPLGQSLLAISDTLYLAVAAIMLFALFAAGFSIFFMRHLFLKPIASMTEVLQAVKERDGDISATLPDSSYDEIAEMAQSYNGFSDSLKQMIADTRLRSVKVSLSASQLQKVILEARNSAQKQEEQAQQVFQASHEASEAIKGIASHTQNIAHSNDSNLDEIRGTGGEMRHVRDQMRAIEHEVSDFQTVVQKLSENSENIIKVLTLVQDFSEQTNLLALNASIEAARAGEAGRGFSVVADEVRTLSQKVNSATQEIDNNIQQMVTLVETTRSGAVNIMNYVSETDSFISQANDKFETMITDFERVSEQMNEIGAAIEELSYTNQNTHQGVTGITDLSNAIKSEMERSADHSVELESATEEMQELLSRFSIGYGGFEDILSKTKAAAAKTEAALNDLSRSGVNMFDRNYVRINPDQLPEKFDTAYTDRYDQVMRPLFDRVLVDHPEFAIACAFDSNGYVPSHNTKVSQPMTGDFDKDNALSRHRRLYNATKAERRRADQTSPFLLLTFIRDTGEIMNSISIPLYVDGQFWGNFCTGFTPDQLLNT